MASLSAIVFKENQLASIASQLGTASNLFKMLKQSNLESQRDEWNVHEIVLTVLQSLGLPKKGLVGQQALTDKNRYANSQIIKVLPKLNEKQTAQLQSVLSDESIDYLRGKKWNKLAAALQDLIITKGKAVSCSKAHAKIERATAKQGKLDDWQEEMIKRVQNGSSILLTGPPSGGKTFASMVALDTMLSENSDIFVVYVAPTPHLAFQVYSNTKATFPNIPMTLLSSIVTDIQPQAGLIIGTPVEILGFLTSNDINYAIGIIDEVHMIMHNSEIGTNLAKILTRCKSQILALSATVPVEEREKLGEQISKYAKVEMTYLEYTKRSVPLFEHYYDGENISSEPLPVKSNDDDALLNLLVKMRTKQLLPSLCFFQDDIKCYERFRSFVKYLQKKDASEYKHWYEINDQFKDKVKELQKSIDTIQLDRAEGRSDSIKGWDHNRFGLISEMEKALDDAIKKSEGEERKDLEKELKIIANLRNEEYGICSPCNGVGLKYRFGQPVENFKWMMQDAGDKSAMLNLHRMRDERKDFSIANASMNTNKEHNKFNERHRNLVDAEGIDYMDSQSILKIMNRAAEYGISIILPTFPFVIQVEVLKLIADKKLGLVFAGSSMASGVNYPFRTVVIHNDGVVPYPDYLVTQMAGRAGRRGFDNNGGHVIYWNNNQYIAPCTYYDDLYVSMKPATPKISEDLEKKINSTLNPKKPKLEKPTLPSKTNSFEAQRAYHNKMTTYNNIMNEYKIKKDKNRVRCCSSFDAKELLTPLLPLAKRIRLEGTLNAIMDSTIGKTKAENYQLISDINRINMYIHRLYLELQESSTILAKYLYCVYHFLHIYSVHLLTF